MNKANLMNRIKIFFDENYTDEQIKNNLNLKDNRDWSISEARKSTLDEKFVKVMSYRPFDYQYIYYDTGLIDFARENTLKDINQDNIGIIFSRQATASEWSSIQVDNKIIDNRYHTSYKGIPQQAPLYLYTEEENTQTELLDAKETSTDTPKRVPNLDPEIVADIASAIGLTFTAEKTDVAGTFAPIDILDYIYAVLHSPTYRETYKEFLKIDFPRVPYPSDVETFWQLVALGGELRQIHLLESPQLKAQIKTLNLAYPKQGDNSVTRKMTTASIGFELNEGSETIGKVWINDEQYFDNVPLIAWEFYIGGYQPAQKWLKDRRERSLDHNDVAHYMNIIAALSLTDSLMQQIDAIDVV